MTKSYQRRGAPEQKENAVIISGGFLRMPGISMPRGVHLGEQPVKIVSIFLVAGSEPHGLPELIARFLKAALFPKQVPQIVVRRGKVRVQSYRLLVLSGGFIITLLRGSGHWPKNSERPHKSDSIGWPFPIP